MLPQFTALKMDAVCSSERLYPPTGLNGVITQNTIYEYHIKQKVLEITNRLLSLIRHELHRKRRAQQFFYYCVYIRCRGNVYTEQLPRNNRGIFTQPSPRNDRDTHTDTQTGGRDL
jgi:hypothetical protein